MDLHTFLASKAFDLPIARCPRRHFQETMSRFALTPDAEPAVSEAAALGQAMPEATSTRDLLLRPYFFDCLHLDGADLLDAPLSERRAVLTK